MHDFSSIEVESAGPGKAVSLGSLRVPPNWPTPASKNEQNSPTPSADAPTTPAATPPGRAFRESLMKTMTEPRTATETADRHQDDQDEPSEK